MSYETSHGILIPLSSPPPLGVVPWLNLFTARMLVNANPLSVDVMPFFVVVCLLLGEMDTLPYTYGKIGYVANPNRDLRHVTCSCIQFKTWDKPALHLIHHRPLF